MMNKKGILFGILIASIGLSLFTYPSIKVPYHFAEAEDHCKNKNGTEIIKKMHQIEYKCLLPNKTIITSFDYLNVPLWERAFVFPSYLQGSLMMLIGLPIAVIGSLIIIFSSKLLEAEDE